VLVSNLVAGASCLLVLVAIDAWPLAIIGAVYVLIASGYLGFFARAWLVPWLGAVALWVWLLASVMFESTVSHYAVSLVAGLAVGSRCLVAWQALAAGAKQVLFGRRSFQLS
jgi:hypothetical protein